MGHWSTYPMPAMRAQALHGDRIVRCFEPRPCNLQAMFAAACDRAPHTDAVVCDGERVSYALCDAIGNGWRPAWRRMAWRAASAS